MPRQFTSNFYRAGRKIITIHIPQWLKITGTGSRSDQHQNRTFFACETAHTSKIHWNSLTTSSASKFSHSTDMLCHLHWLPVQCRIQFKLALLAFNAGSNNAPLYLSCLLHNYVPGRSLRSSQSNLLRVRRINLILAHVVSALPRLLYGTHFLQTFVDVHFMAFLSVS